jgi:hypothetical protein
VRLQQLRSRPDLNDDEVVQAHFIAINSMELFLGAISEINETFTVTPFSFEIKGEHQNAIIANSRLRRPGSRSLYYWPRKLTIARVARLLLGQV